MIVSAWDVSHRRWEVVQTYAEFTNSMDALKKPKTKYVIEVLITRKHEQNWNIYFREDIKQIWYLYQTQLEVVTGGWTVIFLL